MSLSSQHTALIDHRLRHFFLVVLVVQVIINNDDYGISVSSWSPTCHIRPIHSPRSPNQGRTIIPATGMLFAASTNSATEFGSNPNPNRGFLKKKKKKEKLTPASSIYSQPALYDLAFGYRDFPAEVDFLLSQHYSIMSQNKNLNDNNKNHQASPLSILEVAAGPARHALEAIFRQYHHRDQTTTARETIQVPPVSSVLCIDNSPQMIEYAQQLAKEMIKDGSDDDSTASFEERFQYIQADMRNFTIAQSSSSSFDTAWILLGSLQHLTTNADVMACFHCIHDALALHGTLFVELPHPREWLGMIDCTRNSWIVPIETKTDDDDPGKNEKNDQPSDTDDSKNTAGSGQLEIVWGDEDDHFDPMTQIRQFTVQFEMKTNQNNPDEPFRLRQVVPMRMFTALEMDLLGRSTGFRLVKYFGALEEGVDVNDEDAAFRMVCAFQKL